MSARSMSQQLRGVRWANAAGTAQVRDDGSTHPALAGTTVRQLQDVINACGRADIGGSVSLSDALLLGSGCAIDLKAGSIASGSGTYKHAFARTGNAEYLDNGIPGVYILAATQRSSYGTASLVFTLSGTTLTYTAPGDTAGTPVSIASVVSVATSKVFTVTSGNGTDQIHVNVHNATRSGDSSKTLRIEPVTGAKAITWVRNGSTFVATEAAHDRRVGDLAIVFGAAAQHGYIIAADANTWTLADTAGASSGSGQAYGVRDISITGANGELRGNHSTLTSSNILNWTHAITLFACSKVRVQGLRIRDYQKYGVFTSGCTDQAILDITADSGDVADTVHVCGPARNAKVKRIVAKTSDNIVGIGCCDYIGQNLFFPAAGVVDIEGYEIDGVQALDTTYEPVRIYNANSGWLRNGAVRNVHGTYDASTSCALSIITDAGGSQVDAGATNIDGLDISGIDARRSNGSHSPAISATGSGTRRGVRIDAVPARACNSGSDGAININAVFEDLTVSPMDGNPVSVGKPSLADSSCGFSGAYLNVRGSGRIKHLTINLTRRMRGNNQLPVTLGTGSATTPCILLMESAGSQVDHLSWFGGVLDDISGSGTKITAVRNVGVITVAEISHLRQLAGDAMWRQLSGSNAATQIYLSGVDVDASYMFATDVAIAVTKLSNSRMRTGSAFHLGATTGAYRIDASGCTFDARFVRNAAGSPTITVRAVASSAGTPLDVSAGTPSIRLGGDWDMSIDGALLDATVANHAAGAKFYNTSATAFSSIGVGALVRGASAFTRVAA